MKPKLVSLLLVLAAAGPFFLWGFRSSKAYRIELGGADEAYRSGPWGRDYQDHGPFRLRRGDRRMTYFQARMAFDGARLRIPRVVAGGDAELRLRVHRYGQPGIVRLFAGGVELGSLMFEEHSYPWDVRRIPVPVELLRRDPFEVELVREETRERVDLPPRAVCAFDWVELAPSGEARLRPTPLQWFFALLGPVLVLGTLSFAGAPTGFAASGALAVVAAIASVHAALPGSASYAVSRSWLAFPLGGILFWISTRVFRTEAPIARALSGSFALVLLVSSTILFWPDHLPPDVRPHVRQLNRVEEAVPSVESFWELSSSYGKDGRTLSLGRAHPDADYVAPYPPWSYFLVQGLRFVLDEPRFLLEYLGVVFAALVMVLVFALAATLGGRTDGAVLAAALAACDISIWHHASRAHMPALLGELLLVAAIAYLVARYETIGRVWVALRFALLALMATLSYSATLLHFVVLIGWLVLIEMLYMRSLLLERRGRAILLASVAGTLAAFAIFYRHFIGGAGAFRQEGYVAPASFFFLRNQVRDTVAILVHGYPAFVATALPAYVFLRSWVPSGFFRRVVWAWTAAYVTFLVLKDPLFFPALLLQVKEDLLVAPLFCALGGLGLGRLWGRGRSGRIATSALLAVLLLLRVNDYVYNADTIHPP